MKKEDLPNNQKKLIEVFLMDKGWLQIKNNGLWKHPKKSISDMEIVKAFESEILEVS